MLSRERVNKGTKRMNSLPLSPLVISIISCDFTGTAAYKSALNSYLGLCALSKKFLVCIKFDKGGNSFPKHFERTKGICSNL